MDNPLEKYPELQHAPTRQKGSGQSWLKILGIVVVACAVSTMVAVTAVYFYLFPAPFKPVSLSKSEEQILEQKLERLDSMQRSPALHKNRLQPDHGKGLQAERYTETDANRQIILTERELNALLAKNTDLASKLAIDLSEDLASAKLLIPLDEEFPILGGKILKVRAGMELAYTNNRPGVVLKGVSVMGVPIPNAWLGGMKNIDLVEYYSAETGFWKAFAEGVDNIHIEDGNITMELKE